MGHRVRHYHRPRSQVPGTPASQGPSGTPTLVLSTAPSTPDQSGVPFTTFPIVQLQDGLGNNVAQAGVNILVNVSPVPSVSQAITPTGGSPALTDATGQLTYTAFSLTGLAGNYVLTWSATGYNNVATTIALTAGAPNPANFTATVPSTATQNTTVTITIQARDAAGNACTAATNSVVVNINGAQTGSATVTNNNNGTYTATYLATTVGTDTITVTADGVGISGSPFSLQVSAPSSTNYPNKPASAATLYEWSCAGLWADTTGINQSSGNGILAGIFRRFPSGAFATTDATAPQSPSGVCAYVWPAGLSIGNSDGIWFICWKDTVNTEVNTLYESIRVRIPGSNFECTNAAGQKMMGFWAVGFAPGTGADNQIYGWTTGSGLATAMTLEVRQQNVVSRAMTQNLDGTARLTCGGWHQIEYLYQINDVGVANGKCDVWIDGHHVLSYTDVTWRTATNPHAFFKRKWDPTWGGNGTQTKTQTDTLYLDHIYGAGS